MAGTLKPILDKSDESGYICVAFDIEVVCFFVFFFSFSPLSMTLSVNLIYIA